MKLIMSNGECLIDKEDYEVVSQFKWYIASHGYVRRSSDKIYLHRFLMGSPEKLTVDHINRNKLDNRKSNLRICTQKENNRNRSKFKDKSSTYLGVTKIDDYWRVTVHNKVIGHFWDEEDAAIIYNRKVKELSCDFSLLNNIEDDGRKIETILQEKKTSKRKGVYLRWDKKKWVAQNWSNGKSKYIGSFDTEEEAIAAQEKYLSKHS